MAKRNNVTGQDSVFLEMQKHPGVVFTSASLRDDMRLPDDSNNSAAKAIGASMGKLAEKGLIERVGTGKYLYRKAPVEKQPAVPVIVTPEHAEVFEYIGKMKDGSTIAKGDDGNIYRFELA